MQPFTNENFALVFNEGVDERIGGQYATYNISSGSVYGDGGTFVIKHSEIKANKYKITVYAKIEDDEAYKNNNEFYIKVEIVDMPVTLAAAKGTFCCDRALDFTDTGINAYLITGVASSGVLASTAVTKVPANTPLYLEGSAGTVNVPVILTTDASVDVSSNKLKQGAGSAVAATEEIESVEYTNFILTNKLIGDVSAPLMFYKANGNAVPTNKAYLQLLTTSVGAREFVWFEDDMTGIEKVSVDTKALNGAVYNLAGQRVAQPTKGLYIVNGKKVVLK